MKKSKEQKENKKKGKNSLVAHLIYWGDLLAIMSRFSNPPENRMGGWRVLRTPPLYGLSNYGDLSSLCG